MTLTIEYSSQSESVCVCVCVRVCVCDMKFENIVVYENISDKAHYRIKVNVMVAL